MFGSIGTGEKCLVLWLYSYHSQVYWHTGGIIWLYITARYIGIWVVSSDYIAITARYIGIRVVVVGE